MGGLRANANRCGVFASLAGGQTHPRGPLVRLAIDEVGRYVACQGASRMGSGEIPTTTCPAGPSFPRRGAAEYGSAPRQVKVDFFAG